MRRSDRERSEFKMFILRIVVIMQVLKQFNKTLWHKWSNHTCELHKFDFPEKDVHQTMANWAQNPSSFLLDFESLPPAEQISLGCLSYTLDISFLKTLYMLSIVRWAQKCTSIEHWRAFVEEAKMSLPQTETDDVLKADPHLVLTLPPSETCAEPHPRTGAKRPACEY